MSYLRRVALRDNSDTVNLYSTLVRHCRSAGEGEMPLPRQRFGLVRNRPRERGDSRENPSPCYLISAICTPFCKMDVYAVIMFAVI